MKRLIRTPFRIEVTINLEYEHNGIAASTVDHPYSISRRNRLDEVKLTILNDIVDSSLSCIESAEFPIINQWQSKKSYTYYVQFQPVDEAGNKTTPVEIIFRISGDHSSKTLNEDVVNSSAVAIKSIKIGPNEYANPISVVIAIDEMCKELKKGNMDVLNKYIFS